MTMATIYHLYAAKIALALADHQLRQVTCHPEPGENIDLARAVAAANIKRAETDLEAVRQRLDADPILHITGQH